MRRSEIEAWPARFAKKPDNSGRRPVPKAGRFAVAITGGAKSGGLRPNYAT